eukprot:3466463-Rhodomonas_salina.1
MAVLHTSTIRYGSTADRVAHTLWQYLSSITTVDRRPLRQYQQLQTTIRELSTAHRVAHTRAQYCTSRSTHIGRWHHRVTHAG